MASRSNSYHHHRRRQPAVESSPSLLLPLTRTPCFSRPVSLALFLSPVNHPRTKSIISIATPSTRSPKNVHHHSRASHPRALCALCDSEPAELDQAPSSTDPSISIHHHPSVTGTGDHHHPPSAFFSIQPSVPSLHRQSAVVSSNNTQPAGERPTILQPTPHHVHTAVAPLETISSKKANKQTNQPTKLHSERSWVGESGRESERSARSRKRAVGGLRPHLLLLLPLWLLPPPPSAFI